MLGGPYGVYFNSMAYFLIDEIKTLYEANMALIKVGDFVQNKLRAKMRPIYKRHNGDYCWICGSKDCKSPRAHADYQEAANKIKLRSRIWCIIRSDWEHNLLNVGMSTDCLDKPIAYSAHIGNYEITHWANSKKIEIYKAKIIRDIPRLHYFYYQSPGVIKIFDDCQEELCQEELAKLANKNWAKSPNFVRNKTNLAAMREMKKKYIKCLEYDKQIIYSEEEKKYISYNYALFCEQEGYSW